MTRWLAIYTRTKDGKPIELKGSGIFCREREILGFWNSEKERIDVARVFGTFVDLEIWEGAFPTSEEGSRQ